MSVLRVEGLPKGWTGSTAKLSASTFSIYAAPNGTKALLTISAPADAVVGTAVPFRVFAKATLDGFLRITESPPPNAASFAVKVAISDKKETEYFWISPFSWSGDSFEGRLNSTPRLVKHVREGQNLQFKRTDIVDWMYVDRAAQRMHGNFTACALLTKEKPEEAARFQKHYGLECDL